MPEVPEVVDGMLAELRDNTHPAWETVRSASAWLDARGLPVSIIRMTGSPARRCRYARMVWARG